MTYHFIYKTVNLLNNKYYYGVHSTENLNDGYLGSGKILKRAVTKHGKENFERTIISIFDSRIEALYAENILVSTSVVDDKLSYNMTIGGGAPPILWGKRPGSRPEQSKRMKQNNPSTNAKGENHWLNNRAVVYDGEKNISISRDDPRYISGELKSHNWGKVTVKDSTGACFHTTRDDPRYISGELKHVTSGLVLECPYCKKVGGNSMKRWHFENCRQKSCV